MNFLVLCWISIKVRIYTFFEERRVQALFYFQKKFRNHDLALKKLYRFRNPYRMSKNFMRKMGAQDVDTYGETPITTLWKIAQECKMTKEDHLIELGCGRGRGVFFLNDLIGCRATGIEWNPDFVHLAQQAVNHDDPTSLCYICSDMLSADLSDATMIYLFGTCLSDQYIKKLIQRIEQLHQPPQVITVSYPLSDYSDHWQVIKEFEGSFVWGSTSIFLNRKGY